MSEDPDLMLGRRVGHYVVMKKCDGYNDTYWCKCDCGKIFQMTTSSIRSQKKVSCGCIPGESGKERKLYGYPKKVYQGKNSGLSERKCHDCGARTTDYRCPKCQRKWREKHGISPTA